MASIRFADVQSRPTEFLDFTIKGLLVRLPGLQGTAGYVKHLGHLTLGHPSGFKLPIALTLLRPFEPLPALMAILMATLRELDDCSHSDFLFRSVPCVSVRPTDGEV